MSFVKPSAALCHALHHPQSNEFRPAHFNSQQRLGFALLFLFLSLFFSLPLKAQSKWVFEHYNYINQPEESSFVPMLHFQTSSNWDIELRYNYEDAQTLSAFAGKTVEGGENLRYSVTPMIGFSAGRFTGISPAINGEAAYKKMYAWAQSQYSIAANKTAGNFFFNWSELGYNISPLLYSGIAMQYTQQHNKDYFDPGFVAGMNFKSISIPVYVFSPFKQDRYYIIGLNYEYISKKKTINSQSKYNL